MIELIFFTIIISLIGYIVYKEKRHENHIKFLEEKITKTIPQIYWAEKNEGKKPLSNEMAKQSREEVPIADIPMLEFTDRDFKIELEGDSETPAEARARKE